MIAEQSPLQCRNSRAVPRNHPVRLTLLWPRKLGDDPMQGIQFLGRNLAALEEMP
jgi:hypothetical protein